METDKDMKKYYKKSRRIIGILAVLISFIALINEDITMKFVVCMFVFGVAFATSSLTVSISEKIIKTGDAIANKYVRILFYVAILPLTLLVAYVLYGLVYFIYTQTSETINGAGITIFTYIATTVMVIVPYVQTLIVLMLLRFDIKEEKDVVNCDGIEEENKN